MHGTAIGSKDKATMFQDGSGPQNGKFAGGIKAVSPLTYEVLSQFDISRSSEDDDLEAIISKQTAADFNKPLARPNFGLHFGSWTVADQDAFGNTGGFSKPSCGFLLFRRWEVQERIIEFIRERGGKPYFMRRFARRNASCSTT